MENNTPYVVACIGHACIDVLLSDYVTRLEGSETEIIATKSRWQTGGCALNNAIALSRLGFLTDVACFMSKKGWDFASKIAAKNSLVIPNECCDHMADDLVGSITFARSTSDGIPLYAHYLGSNSKLDFDRTISKLVPRWTNVKVVSIGAIGLLPGLERKEQSRKLFNALDFYCEQAITIADTNILSSCKTDFRNLIYGCSVFAPNFNELHYAADFTVAKDRGIRIDACDISCLRLFESSKKLKHIIVKRGDMNVLHYVRRNKKITRYQLPACSEPLLEEHTNTSVLTKSQLVNLGVGDAWLAAFTAMLLSNKLTAQHLGDYIDEFNSCILHANILAFLSMRGPDAFATFPTGVKAFREKLASVKTLAAAMGNKVAKEDITP